MCHKVLYAVKGKEYHTPWAVLMGCSSPLLRPWARRWINHLSLWRMARATPNLQLPSQSQDIAVPRLVPNYTAWRQRHMRMNNFPKVVTWQWNGRELNSLPVESQANALTIHHQAILYAVQSSEVVVNTFCCVYCYYCHVFLTSSCYTYWIFLFIVKLVNLLFSACFATGCTILVK